MSVIVQKRKWYSSKFSTTYFSENCFLIHPGLAPTFISDGAVGIANILLMRQHILGAQNKYAEHGWTVVTAGSATSNNCKSQCSALWSHTEMDHCEVGGLDPK